MALTSNAYWVSDGLEFDDSLFEEELSCFMYNYTFASTDGRKTRRNGSTVVVAMFKSLKREPLDLTSIPEDGRGVGYM